MLVCLVGVRMCVAVFGWFVWFARLIVLFACSVCVCLCCCVVLALLLVLWLLVVVLL